MKCPKCKKEISEGLEKCPNCQYSIDEDTMILTGFEANDELKVEKKTYKNDTLLIISGPGTGEEFNVEGRGIMIGRDPSSDIFLNDITVSRKHCKISFKDKEAVLVDLNSLNGTYVNGLRVDEKQIQNRDEIQVGKFKLVYFHPPR